METKSIARADRGADATTAQALIARWRQSATVGLDDPVAGVYEGCADDLEAALAAPALPAGARELLSFESLRVTNKARCEAAFHKVDEWKPWEWSNALAGEVGEACNLTKKMNRIWPANQFKQNWNKPEDQRLDDLAQRVADEVADAVIYADLLLTSMGRSLAAAIVKKFNEKSDEIGSPIKLARDTPPAEET